MHLAKLDDYLAQRGFLFAVSVCLDTGEKYTSGDRTALESDYVVRTMFDDLTSEQLSEYLEGQLLPRMAKQGKVCGIICKPNNHLVVGLYYHDQRDVVSRYHLCEETDRELKEMFGN